MYDKCPGEVNLYGQKMDLWLLSGERVKGSKACRVSFPDGGDVPKLIVANIVQLCEYTKSFRIIHFK